MNRSAATAELDESLLATAREAPELPLPQVTGPGRLFALTLMLSAGLLFGVQPMVARATLPALGGVPAVWNTCMVFFQAILLAGYGYAHLLATRCGFRRQVVVHAMVVATSFVLMPIQLSITAPRGAASPVTWLLATLAWAVGVPFFVLATSSPLLQKWYEATGSRDAADPYFLYAASNVGSMAALLGYPLVVEPTLGLARQGGVWSVAYVLLGLLVVACGVATARGRAFRPDTIRTKAAAEVDSEADRTGGLQYLRWVGLAFLPSSLMLGVTSYISADIAAVPLLWVVPLALYLLSFILVFARREWIRPAFMAAAMPPLVLLLAWTLAVGSEPRLALMVVHLATYFVVAMVVHGRLAADRPPAQQLTGFFLALSAGGVLGGIFNALIAPQVFSLVAEYPLVLGLACLALPRGVPGGRKTPQVVNRLAVAIGAGALGVFLWSRLVAVDWPWRVPMIAAGIVAALGAVGFRRRPVWLAATCLVLVAASLVHPPRDGRVLWRGRDFFGVLTVMANRTEHRLVHGCTLHGRQFTDPARRGEPLAYFHRGGPVGDLFRTLEVRKPDRARVGVVGLGAGSMAAYARPGQLWTFFEIDPAVVRVARDPRFFTYLTDCRATQLDVVLGDARIQLQQVAPATFDLLVLDAFSSDAIPVHLLTREALDLDRSRVVEGGLMAFHISNRYVDLAPVLGAWARQAGWTCRVRADLDIEPRAQAEGRAGSIWAVVARQPGDLGPLATDPRWKSPEIRPGDRVWTDDSNDLAARLVGLK